MRDCIFHVGIGSEYDGNGFEYRLPLSRVPAEVDSRWSAWVSTLIDVSAENILNRIRERFHGLSPELAALGNLVTGFTPFSLLIYNGTPLVWMEKALDSKSSRIYLPPEVDPEEVRSALRPHGLDFHDLLVELFSQFGGMGNGRPWEAAEISGARRRGKLLIEPASKAIEAGCEHNTELENREIRRNYASWLKGVEVIAGDDGVYWHIGPDGTICQHESGTREVWRTFPDLASLIAAVVAEGKVNPFHGIYYCFRSLS